MRLNEQTRGWLRHLWRKATTEDDWSIAGEPHPWWDQYSVPPMLAFPRFDLSESSYALLLMGRRTPAWREVYTRILDELVRRHTTHWAAVDWLTQIGPDPDRASYPRRYRALMPKDLWGHYDVPGWTANGVEPWGIQPDPIGADGNLFFRGFFTLLLGIHRAVSGESTWESPFDVTGIDRAYPWTHGQIARYLCESWEKNPDGPHCENTKVWPYCLSAAALGLQMTDLTTGSKTHHVYDHWLEHTFKTRFLEHDARGNLKKVGLYHDPLLERTHAQGRAAALAPVFYMMPQNRELAEYLYREAVASIGWNRWWLPVLGSKRMPRMFSIGLLLAREFGDHTTERRLARRLARFENGRFFDADTRGISKAGGDEFGFFFAFDEPYPRGQESALLMLRELLDGEGELFRAFTESDAEKFRAPTVVDVDYPKLGLATAQNDSGKGALELETYVATSADAGAPTRFRVTQLPDAAAVRVLCDGDPYQDWSAQGPDAIELRTDVAAHRFEIHTGYRADALPAGAAAAGASAPGSGAAGASTAQLRARDLVGAPVALRSVSVGCPCCA